jgi:malate/lactate dehydrogenase
VLSRRGVDEVQELDLEPAELADLRAAAEAVRAKCAELDEALGLD